MNLPITIENITKENVLTSFKVRFSEKIDLQEVMGFLAEEYQQTISNSVSYMIHHEREVCLREECIYSPVIHISPVNDSEEKTDYFRIQAGGNISIRKRIQTFQNHLVEKYS